MTPCRAHSAPQLQQLADLGWLVVDHAVARTAEEHGAWAPSVLDAVMLSRAAGFVGTPWSTFSGASGHLARGTLPDFAQDWRICA
jgi:hypothetical protein